MVSRKVYASFWRDSFVRRLNAKEKLLWLYYTTTESVNSLYCYEVSDEQVLMEVNCFGEVVVKEQDILKFKNKVEEANKMRFFEDWVYLVNGQRYDNYGGKQVEKSRVNQYRRLSPRVRAWFSEVSGFYVEEKKLFVADDSETEVDSVPDMIPGLIDEEEVVAEPVKKTTATIAWLDNMPEDEVVGFMDKFSESREVILNEAERCAAWCRAHDKRLKNYKAQFRNWMDSDYRRVKAKPPNGASNGSGGGFRDLSHLGAETRVSP